MTGEWMKISIDNLGIDIIKQSADLPALEWVNKIADGFGQLREGLCFSSAPDNTDYILFAHYNNPANEDIIRIWPCGTYRQPCPDVSQLRDMYVCGAEWDVLFVVWI
jgi:hypothetical protein